MPVLAAHIVHARACLALLFLLVLLVQGTTQIQAVRILSWLFNADLSTTSTTTTASSSAASSPPRPAAASTFAPVALSKPSKENLPEPLQKQYGWLMEGEQGRDNGRFSACWRQAMGLLSSSCKDMDMPTKQRVALHLASCHLEEGGRPSVRCPDKEKDVRVCLKRVQGDAAWATYTDLFLFADTYCHSLQADAWQAQTEALINHLGQSSLQAVSLLHDSADTQRELLEHQQASTRLQEELVKAQTRLHEGLESSTRQFGRLTDEVETGFGAIGQQYQSLLNLQESNLQRQVELLAGLHRANEEVREFTSRMEEEFAKESQRFSLVKQVLGQASVVLDIFLHGWRLASIGVFVAALWTLAPTTTLVYARKASAVIILLATIVGLIRTLTIPARRFLPAAWLPFKALAVVDAWAEGFGGGFWVMYYVAVLVILLSLWRRVPSPLSAAWEALGLWRGWGLGWGSSSSGEEGEEKGGEDDDDDDGRWSRRKEFTLRAMAEQVVHGGGGGGGGRGAAAGGGGGGGGGGARWRLDGGGAAMLPGSASAPAAAPAAAAAAAASRSGSGTNPPMYSVRSCDSGTITPCRRSPRLQSCSPSPFSGPGRACSGGGGGRGGGRGGLATLHEEED